jgi:ketosteroid isomerase-like protein
MANRPIAEELLALEKRYWNALKHKDTNAAMRLTAEPCIVAGAQGVAQIDHRGLAKMMENASWDLEHFELEDAQVKLVSDDVAIVAYKVKEKLNVEGKPVELEAAEASTWVWSKDRWLCAVHSEAIVGDPFGRDRGTSIH